MNSNSLESHCKDVAFRCISRNAWCAKIRHFDSSSPSSSDVVTISDDFRRFPALVDSLFVAAVKVSVNRKQMRMRHNL
jgi:hypothetical protein